MVKAVPGFLEVSDLWRWVLSSVVALFSGLAVCAQLALTAPLDAIPGSLNKMSPPGSTACTQ
eukprot:5761740-Amphidinium_carterae.1